MHTELRELEITRVGVLTVGKISAVIYGIAGLIGGAIFTLLALAGAGGGGAGVLFGLGAIIILPVLYGVLGFVGGIIAAALYNLAAGKIGGIVIETRSA